MNDREKKELEYKDRALDVFHRSQLLYEEILRYYEEMKAFMVKYPERKVDQMEWMDKERVMAEADKLLGKLNECTTKLRDLDREYQQIREEVNKFYGKEVMGELNIIMPVNRDEEDSADWWKKTD